MVERGSICGVVLTKNEQENLARCLCSLQWCDELVVVDAGSTDRTVQIAKEWNADVLIHQPEGAFSFAAQRNWALDHAAIGADWILFLDADEEVGPNLRELLKKTCADPTHGYTAFELAPQFMYWGKWLRRTQGYPNWHPRLVRNGGPRFCGTMWESFDASARVGRIPLPYLHRANSKGVSDWLKRHDSYSNWEARRVLEYVATGEQHTLGTPRKLRLRQLAARFWPLRPLGKFVYMYLFRFGFLEGIPALAFCCLSAFYELLIVIKVVEFNRKQRGKDL